MLDRDAVDPRDRSAVGHWFDEHRPDAVLLAAARVGGTQANDTDPADLLYDNLAIATNVIEAWRRTGVLKLLFLGSSCIYPRLAPQPTYRPARAKQRVVCHRQDCGPQNEPSLRRQHGCDFVSVMPTNLHGPNDNFDLLSGQILAAPLAKIDANVRESRDKVEIWGSEHFADELAACGATALPLHALRPLIARNFINAGGEGLF